MAKNNTTSSSHIEEVFIEAVNARANGLILTQIALEDSGHQREAVEIKKIRNKKIWNNYVVELIKKVQISMREFSDIDKLRILQYHKSRKMKVALFGYSCR